MKIKYGILSAVESQELLKSLAVNFVLEETENGRLVWQDNLYRYIEELSSHDVIDVNYVTYQLASLSEGHLHDVLENVNTYVAKHDTYLKPTHQTTLFVR